ncbi:hypothetical protein POM88_000496 [Heracleum sosnowskyi]|uniref:Ankyrin n=1 Tax=Heracleum sosnowskyi TaxID=360622 RepID=A0AAD8N9T6_9APIA|nr:hypothetical protein POM88_000496 [Heracleum sosnowskyi]
MYLTDVLNISEFVKLLLDKNKDLLKVPDEYEWTAFHYVAYNNLHTIVDDLVGEDKFVAYLPDKKDKRTTLHVAACKGNICVMKKLVEYFPDCWEIVDGKGQNILHIAVEQDQKEVIRYILSEGCKANNNLLIQSEGFKLIRIATLGENRR